jgi:hypothetical protein
MQARCEQLSVTGTAQRQGVWQTQGENTQHNSCGCDRKVVVFWELGD